MLLLARIIKFFEIRYYYARCYVWSSSYDRKEKCGCGFPRGWEGVKYKCTDCPYYKYKE